MSQTRETGARPQSGFVLRWLLRIRQMVQAISMAAAVVSAAAILLACAAISWAVWARGVMGRSTIWEMEGSVYLLIYAAMLAAAFTDRSGGQIGVGALGARLSGRAAQAHRLILDIMALALFSLMTWSGWQMFIQSWQSGWRSPTVWGPPLWVPHLAIPLGGGLLVLALLVDVLIRLAGGTIAPPDQMEGAH